MEIFDAQRQWAEGKGDLYRRCSQFVAAVLMANGVTSAEQIDARVVRILKREIEKLPPSRARHTFYAARSFLKFCRPQAVEHLGRAPSPRQWRTEGSIERGMAAASRTRHSARNSLILAVMAAVKPKATELANMTVADVKSIAENWDEGARLAVQRFFCRMPEQSPAWHGQRGPLTLRGVQQVYERLSRIACVDLNTSALRAARVGPGRKSSNS